MRYIAERPKGHTNTPLPGTHEKELILGKSYFGYRKDASGFPHRVRLIFDESGVTMYYREDGVLRSETVDPNKISVCLHWFPSIRKVRREG